MNRLELTEDLLTGIDEIDDQHRELFARGNAVLFPEGGKKSVNDAIEALLFLLDYVDEHFASEERLMKYYNYDRMYGHLIQHQRLRRDVKELSRRKINTDTYDGIISELHYLLNDWYVYHIKEWDKAYAAYLQKNAGHDFLTILGLEDKDNGDVEFL